jgi:hypothetical protein
MEEVSQGITAMLNRESFTNDTFNNIMLQPEPLWETFANEHPAIAGTVDGLLRLPYIRYHLRDQLYVPEKDWVVVTQRTLLLLYVGLGAELVNKLSLLSETARFDVICGAMCMANDTDVVEEIAKSEAEMAKLIAEGQTPDKIDMQVAVLSAVCEWLAHECFPTDPVTGMTAILNTVALPYDVSTAVMDNFVDNLEDEFSPEMDS